MKFKVGDRVFYQGDTFSDSGIVVKVDETLKRYILHLDYQEGWRISKEDLLHKRDELEEGLGYWYALEHEITLFACNAEVDKFKVGDRVNIKSNYISGTGTVVLRLPDGRYLVRCDDRNLGWTVSDYDKFYTSKGAEVGPGYWNCEEKELSLIPNGKEKSTADKIEPYEIGERVVVEEESLYSWINGMTGKIVAFYRGLIGIEFDKRLPRFHDCDGAGAKNHCFWVSKDAVKKLATEENKISLEEIESFPVISVKVGDIVRISKWWTSLDKDVIGRTARVETIEDAQRCKVRFPEGSRYSENLVTMFFNQITPVKEDKKAVDTTKPPRTVVVRITDDGATAKYINGKTVEKEVEVQRFWKDKPSDRDAAIYAVGKLFGNTVRATTDESEHAEWASKTAEILRKMDWNDILFKAYVGEKK